MLKIKVYVNDNKIDELDIVNTGHREFGQHLYRIKKPKEYNKFEIYHNREEGWTILVEKILKKINEYNKEPVNEDATPLEERDNK